MIAMSAGLVLCLTHDFKVWYNHGNLTRKSKRAGYPDTKQLDAFTMRWLFSTKPQVFVSNSQQPAHGKGVFVFH